MVSLATMARYSFIFSKTNLKLKNKNELQHLCTTEHYAAIAVNEKQETKCGWVDGCLWLQHNLHVNIFAKSFIKWL